MSDSNLQTNVKSNKKVKTAVIISLSIIAAILIILIALGATIAYTKEDVIYPNIYVGNVKLGNMTVEDAASALEENYVSDDIDLKFTYNDTEFEINGKDIFLTYNHFATAMNALEKGKSENIFAKISGAFTYTFAKHNLPIEVMFNEDKLFKMIAEKLPEDVDLALQTSVVIEGDSLAITNGSEGMGVDIQKLSAKIKESLGKSEDEPFEIIIEQCKPLKYTAESLYQNFHSDPVDAVFSLPPNEIGYSQSKTGIDFDLDNARKILKENENNKETYYIPITVTEPNKSDNWFLENYGEVLGTFTTTYNAATVGRSENIDIASQKINGLILKPGDEFSFNNVVGERSSQNGFKTAKVYSGGQVVDGIGGGICQVSSTLFNAIVYADLQIVYRTNHSMPVSYVANGRDATVSYGEIDFIFANNQPYPVRLDVKSGGGSITCSVVGIKTEDKKIEIDTETVGTTSFKETVIEDPTLEAGTRKVQTAGTNGSQVNTYITKYINGEKVERKLLTKSNYIATNQVVVIGTKPIDEPSDNTASEEVFVPTIPSIELNGDISDFENIQPSQPVEAPIIVTE